MVYFDTHHNSNTKPYLSHLVLINFIVLKRYIHNIISKFGILRMNQQDFTGYIHSTTEQVQSGSERAQSHGQVQFGGGQAQSSSTSMAVQMLKNKNKSREEIKPVEKKRQKVETEKSLESIGRFNQINEEINESHDKQVTKLKQRE